MMLYLRWMLLIIGIAFQAHATHYYDTLKPDEKNFFNAHFTLSDLYGEQNHQEFQRLCTLIPHDDEKNHLQLRWRALREAKDTSKSEDYLKILSRHLRESLLQLNHIPDLPWINADQSIKLQAQLRGQEISGDFLFYNFIAPLPILSSWSPEHDLPYDALITLHPHMTRVLNMDGFELLKARSSQKTVAWHLKKYQAYVDGIEAASAFHRIQHSAKTPRTLYTKKHRNFLERYFSTFADMGDIVASIFKARIHFLRTHEPEIDALLKVGFIPSQQGFSLPFINPNERWHDLRPVDYYFKSPESEVEGERPLFIALPSLLESKRVLLCKQLPLSDETTPLKQLIQQYHALNKKEEATLKKRIELLDKINSTALYLLKEASSAHSFSLLELEHLQELATTSENKSGYLSCLEIALTLEDRCRNLIPLEKKTTTPSEIRNSNREKEIYDDLDPEYRVLPYKQTYFELKRGRYIYPDLKLQKVIHYLKIREDEFIREEEGIFHSSLEEQVNRLFAERFPPLGRKKALSSYFLWLETKNTHHVMRDLRHSVPQRDMLLEVREGKAFNEVFASPTASCILDGMYLYVIPEDAKMYIFPGDRSKDLTDKRENNHLHEVARKKYNFDFEAMETRSAHPLLCKGANVFAAGEVKFRNGQIIHINNNSGHYTPYDYHLLNGLNRLQPVYQALFSNDATVGCLSHKTPLPYGEFMALDITALRKAF